MIARGRVGLLVAAGCAGILCCACGSDDPATTQPAAKPEAQPALTLIAPESQQWTQAEAAARLADAASGLSAAVRLVRLSETMPLCVPDELTDEFVRGLRLLRLNDAFWALGLADAAGPTVLRAPVLIAADGTVTLLAEGAAEELLVLHVSDDADVFPHLAVLPDRVALVGTEVTTALALKPDQPVRFELRTREGYRYVALALLKTADPNDVAVYRWDPFESAFFGPAIDILPDPPGGKFRIDLTVSRHLVPFGGEVPEPESIEQEKPKQQPRRPSPIPPEWRPA